MNARPQSEVKHTLSPGMASVERAWLDNYLAPRIAARANWSPAHRASVERYSAECDEAHQRHLDEQEAHCPSREDAFKRGMGL